jgi:hypothetical protein
MEPGISFFCLNNKGYLPQPPRVWSRVQNSCSLITGPEEGEFVQVPYSTKIIPYAELGSYTAMLSKGNVLQYKKNSSNLTKQQIYSQIAKGQWTNRTKTWATQSDRGYTNPNNQSYIRVGATNVTLDGAPTFLPVTCPRFPIINNGVLPVIAGGGNQNNVLPPPILPAPNAGGSVIPLVPVVTIEPIVIQDFGNLVCGTFENLCTGEIIRPILLDNCHPTTDSDVPGPIEELCWNDGNPTWYPRQRYVMTNSTDKWPINAELGSAVIFDAPRLSATVDCNIVTLSWPFDPFYTSFNIYQNGLIIASVNGFTNTFTITINNPETDSFFIKGVNGNIESALSNTVSITIDPPPAPTNLTVTTVCNVATLNWDENFDCFVTYQVYENGVLIATTTQTSLGNITFDTVGTYNFYVIALFGAIASAQSNTVSTTIVPPPAPTNLTINTVCNVATLTWSNASPCNLSYQVYKNGTLIATTTNTSLNNIQLDALGTYNFYVIALLGSIASAQSGPVSTTIVPPPAPVLLPVTTVCDDATLNWTNSSTCSLTYQVYANGSLIATTTNTTYNFTLQDNVLYTFYVVAFLGSIASANSNPETAIYIPFSAPTISVGLFYTLNIDVNNVYTYQFTSGTGTITFNSGITNAEILVVGPGGNGGPGDANIVIDEGPGGGGGAGGKINYQSNISFITNQICNVVVGTNPTSSVFDTYNAAVGANGVIITGGVGANGGGSGGTGGLGTGLAGPTPGANGTQYSIGSFVNSTYSGGGGGGGIGPGGGQTGGAGGTGGGGKGSNSGGGVCNPGVANTGGGGGGSSSTSDPLPIPGCPGGSGVVILSFQASVC